MRGDVRSGSGSGLLLLLGSFGLFFFVHSSEDEVPQSCGHAEVGIGVFVVVDDVVFPQGVEESWDLCGCPSVLGVVDE